MRIIGYAFDADLHCIDCTAQIFAGDLDFEKVKDMEGNLIHPIWNIDEDSEKEYCGDCLEKLSD